MYFLQNVVILMSDFQNAMPIAENQFKLWHIFIIVFDIQLFWLLYRLDHIILAFYDKQNDTTDI